MAAGSFAARCSWRSRVPVPAARRKRRRDVMRCHHPVDALASRMRTTIDIDPHLLKRLRDEAHRRGVPFKPLLMTVLRRGLDDTPTARRRRYRCPTFAMGEPAHASDLDKALRLASAMEDEETLRKLRLRK